MAETLAYAQWCADFDDWQKRQRRMPANVISVPGGRWRALRYRLLGR
jgi:hypothetical protein